MRKINVYFCGMKKMTALFAAFMSVTAVTAQVEIYNEDFQNGLPATFTVVDNDGLTPAAAVSEYIDAWIEIVDPADPADTIMASTSYFDPIGQADRWLITDAINLGSYGNIAYWETRSYDPSYPDGYFILVSSTDTQLTSFTDTLDVVYQENETWTAHSGNLSDLGLDNQTIYLAFVNRTYDGFKLFIDDIRVEMEDPVGVTALEMTPISIYPNPSNDVINVSGIQDIKEIKVYAVSGALLLTSSTSSLDVSQLDAGKYFITVQGADRVGRSTFVKY